MDRVRTIYVGYQVSNDVNFGRSVIPPKKLPIFKSIKQNRMGHISSGVDYQVERYQVDSYRKLRKEWYKTGADYMPASSMLEMSKLEIKGEE
jgi:hypothetical protein